MGLYTTIAQRSMRSGLHSKLDSLPYFVRYQSSQLRLADIYRHLTQILPIYEAIEAKINSLNMKTIFPERFYDLCERANAIKSDLEFMRQHFHFEQDDTILPSTLAYLDAINNEKSAASVLGHFLVGILGDLHGGQSLKRYIQRTYTDNGLKINEGSTDGIHYYTFKNGTLADLMNWLNQTTFDNQPDILEACDKVYENQIAIIKELEATRKISVSEHVASFFAQPKVRAVAALTLTSAGLAALYLRSNV